MIDDDEDNVQDLAVVGEDRDCGFAGGRGGRGTVGGGGAGGGVGKADIYGHGNYVLPWTHDPVYLRRRRGSTFDQSTQGG